VPLVGFSPALRCSASKASPSAILVAKAISSNLVFRVIVGEHLDAVMRVTMEQILYALPGVEADGAARLGSTRGAWIAKIRGRAATTRLPGVGGRKPTSASQPD
jgi:hypothetical protein